VVSLSKAGGVAEAQLSGYPRGLYTQDLFFHMSSSKCTVNEIKDKGTVPENMYVRFSGISIKQERCRNDIKEQTIGK
jgi:hypothetical protein